MLPGRDLGDDAAVPGVDIDLCGDDVGEDATGIVDNAHRRFVTACFDAQDIHQYRFNVTVRPVIYPMCRAYFAA